MTGYARQIASQADREGPYLPTLDGWRTIAIGFVLFAHATDSIANYLRKIGIDLNLEQFNGIGLFGVQIFFGLSGLLITSKLITDEARDGRISLRNFYTRRAFRILPALLVYLIVIGLLSLSGVINVSLDNWLATLLFYANYSPTPPNWYLNQFWSLAVEEHFYILWPLLLVALGRGPGQASRRIAIAISLALALAVWRAVDFKFHLTETSAAMFLGRSDIQGDNILWGAVIALMYHHPSWRTGLTRLVTRPWLVPAIIAYLVAFLLHPDIDWKLYFLLLTIKAVLVPLAILGTMLGGARLFSRFLETTPMRLIGRISYSLYLWQQVFLVFDAQRIPDFAVVQEFPGNFVATFVCATVSFLLIEKPSVIFGHRIAPHVPYR